VLGVLFYSCEAADASVDTSNQKDYMVKESYNISSGVPVTKELDLTIGEMDLNPVQYVNWVNEQEVNSLTKTREIGEINFQLKHLPIEFMISNELRKKDVSQTEIDSLLPQYSGMEYYELRISVDDFYDETAKYGVTDMVMYQQRIAYMSFTMQNDLTVELSGGKEVPCQLFHFERTYGVAPYATFLFGFSKEAMGEGIEERTVVLNDNLFNKGLVKFYWHSTELENVPQIQVI
jgi:hypothetical protein